MMSRWWMPVVSMVLVAASAAAAQPQDAAAKASRTREEVDALIDKVGRTTPDWWDSVSLQFPPTLDLSWPEQPPPPWDNQRNIGQYLWDIVMPNPAKWKEGIRFMHHVLALHRNDASRRTRAMRELGRLYQDLLQDYARAAFWWRQAGVDAGNDFSGVNLAECYWKLGNKEMAVELLEKSRLSFAMIKLWADMGEIDKALEFADANLQGGAADLVCVSAGDACRVAGRYQQALDYYRRALAIPAAGQFARRIMRNHQRARSNIEAITLFETLDLRRIPDGTYRAQSMGFETPIEVEVTVRQQRIEAVRVVAQKEKQPYASLIETPAKIVARQGVKGVDTTSRATITSEAIINATAKALAAQMK